MKKLFLVALFALLPFSLNAESNLDKILSSGVLNVLSHEKVLKRGFAIIKDSNFSLIRSSKDVKNKQSLNIQFRDNDILTVKANLKNKE